MFVSDYNRELYESVKAKIGQGFHRIFYSEATGLGKSIIMQLLITEVFEGKKILYIAPKYSIWNNLSCYEAMSGADCLMYAAFYDRQATLEMFDRYDVVFIDECHHMYSDVYGRNIQYAMQQYESKYFIGFTATPKLKGKLASDAFETSCIGMDIYEAVQHGVFPKMRYAVLVPEREGCIFDEDVIVQVQQILSDSGKDKPKCLLYFTCVQELLDFADQGKRWFDGYRFMGIHSRQTKQENKSALEEFNTCSEKAMLLSVDSLLEGVHLTGVNCVVLFRHTQSLNVFLQVVGRLCKPYSKEEPLFIDVADSISGINFEFEAEKPDNKENCRILQSLRDIINVHCKEYKYVEFYEQLRQKDKKLQTYKGFTWCSLYQLGKQLGVSAGAIASWLQRNIGSTVEDYIDFKLRRKAVYREVDCSSLEAIAVALHKSRHDVRVVMDLNNFNKEQYIDFILGGMTLAEYTEKLGIEYYKNVDCYNELSVARCLKLDVSQVRRGVKQCGGMTPYIDSILNESELQEYLKKKNVTKKYCYKGIRYDNEIDVCEQIGVTLKTYRTFMRRTGAKSPKVFIDAYKNIL